MTRRRTEYLNVSFDNGIAREWVFEVPDCFRDQLDIKRMQFVDRDASRELRKTHLKGEGDKLPTIYRDAWSQGVPPMLSFDIGHVFYDPPGIRSMVWSDALKVLRRLAQVKDARPDGEDDDSGWVRYDLHYYDSSTRIRTEERTTSQAEFMNFLRTGRA